MGGSRGKSGRERHHVKKWIRSHVSSIQKPLIRKVEARSDVGFLYRLQHDKGEAQRKKGHVSP